MKKLLVIGYIWPEPKSSAAGIRMLQLIRFFLDSNYEVTFATTAVETPHIANLQKLGVKTAEIALNNSSFDSFAANLNPQIVLFDRFMMEEQFGWRIDAVCPDALKILDTEDLHFLREARMQSWKKGLPAREVYMQSDLAKREIASIYRCDVSLIISEPELMLLKKDFRINEKLLFYLPFLLPQITKATIGDLPAFEERENFISIGNFKHEPNWNAVLYLKEKIWPEIRKALPQAQMHIYGAYASEKVYNLQNEESGFLVKGRAENSKEVIKKAKVLLASIQFGAGLKGKLVEAMQCGTPSVTTALGAEGIAGYLEWNGFIEEKEEDFARAAIQVYTSWGIWEKAQSNGFRIINKRFAKEKLGKSFTICLEELRENIEDHRRENFTGAMLKHHQHRSTYFMARFIEEKNKKK